MQRFGERTENNGLFQIERFVCGGGRSDGRFVRRKGRRFQTFQIIVDTSNQAAYFCYSVLIGFFGAAIYEIFSLLRRLFGCKKGKNKPLEIVLDVLFFANFTIWCIFTSFLLHFPSFRVYIGIGYAAGGIIYFKILHKSVAIFKKVCYNNCVKSVVKIKEARKNSSKEVDIEL